MTITAPITLGTAGHIDHGKTALVRALTGVDTDRLPEERRRGISIGLGYAPLTLPSGRRLSLVDVPGHERFVRTMVAGATGIDVFLLVVAADDGVMPQTREHAAVLAALGVGEGVVAITKCDLAAPDRARREVAELLPGADAVIACSATTGDGIPALARALDAVAARVPTRAQRPGEPVLHLDRSFSVDGVGTVVTGTLWTGTLRVGDTLTLWPGGRRVRVRGLQVHDEPRTRTEAGQRVAVNLAGVRARDVSRGDALAGDAPITESLVLDCALTLRAGTAHGERVQVHHGTRDVPGRLSDLDSGLWQLRLEKPLLAADGDRVVVRRLSPPDTLGGGTILDAAAQRHGRRPDVLARLRARAAGESAPQPQPPAAAVRDMSTPHRQIAHADSDAVAALEDRLRAAGPGMLGEATLDEAGRRALAALRADGRAVRMGGRLYAHREVADAARARVVGLIETTGGASLAEVRDLLGTGRRSAQALLEHLDAERVTRRESDDRRVLRARSAT